MARADELAAITSGPGLTRLYLTPEHKAANDLVSRWMQEAGMAVHIDAVGNVVGRYEGERPGLPALMLGSHLDTVRDAGRYDGMLGVLSAIACVADLNARGRRLPFAIEVVGFGDEEGVRFQSTLIGSRAVAGTLDRGLLRNCDSDGVSMADALTAFGLDPNRIGSAVRRPEEVAAYVELHIEQGPVLEREGIPVGIVTGIAGATRLEVTLTGEAGHAGTVPMHLRCDALAAAAEMVLAVEEECSGRGRVVGTVGRLSVSPGAGNVIPGEVRFSVDIRSDQDEQRQERVNTVIDRFDEIAEGRRMGLQYRVTHDSPAVACSPRLMARLSEAARAEGIEAPELLSGAGHDAMAMTPLCEIGMLFVRCRGGISHNPAESITAEDAETGARVLLRFIENFEG